MNRMALLLLTLALAVPGSRVLAAQADSADYVWKHQLRASLFGDRVIHDGTGVISLDAPYRAENAAIVPLRIKAGFAQSKARYIKSVTVLIDNNPEPLAGVFHFFPQNGRADLALRVRINAYTTVRAIAATNDGQLYMAKKFVKASGGCSAPIGTDLEDAMKRIGRMKFRYPKVVLHQPLAVQLNISHPNISGLQMNQLTHLYIPPHFVKQVRVTYNDRPVLVARTGISISADPSFRFDFVPDRPGVLKAEVTDNKNLHFTAEHRIQPAS